MHACVCISAFQWVLHLFGCVGLWVNLVSCVTPLSHFSVPEGTYFHPARLHNAVSLVLPLCVLVCVYMLFCVFVCVCVNLYAHTHSCVFVCSRQSVCKIKIYFSFASSPNLCDPVRWPVAGRGPEVEKHCCWVPLPQGLCMGLLQQHS